MSSVGYKKIIKTKTDILDIHTKCIERNQKCNIICTGKSKLN